MTSHPAYPRLREMSEKTGKNAFEILGSSLEDMMKKGKAETLSTLVRDNRFAETLRTCSTLDQRLALLS